MGQATLPADGAALGDDEAVVRSRGLMAEYSLGQTEAGGWFAIGSVRCAATPGYHPAWVIVGTGTTAAGAVVDLRAQLEVEARHVVAMT